jgi:hypothetical protein
MQHDDTFADLDRANDYRLAEFNRPSFTQAEVISSTGLTEKRIQNYLARYEGEMSLSVPPPGRGQRRRYSAADAVYLATVRAMSDFGLAPSTAVLLANHVRAWAVVQARRYYEGGFVYLPEQLFGFCSPFEGNESNLMIHAATSEGIQAWAKKYGHDAILIVDGKRIAQETARRLWERYQWTRIDNPED